MQLAALLSALALAAPPAAARGRGNGAGASENALANAEDAYLKGDYGQAQRAARALAAGGRLPAEDRPRLYLLLARLAAAFEDEKGVSRWLRELKRVAPDTQLDPYTDPPVLFHAWQTLAGAPAKAKAKDAVPGSAPPPATAPAPAPRAAGAPDGTAKERSRSWVHLAPFGIGHFEDERYFAGTAFLAADLSLVYLTIKDFTATPLAAPNAPLLRTGPWLLAASYGYELLDVTPAVAARDAPMAESTREVLSFLPFGVGQAKNGQAGKAVGFAIAQAAFLWGTTASGMDETSHQVAAAAFVISYAYGCYDAWAGHIPLHIAVVPGPGRMPGLGVEASL